ALGAKTYVINAEPNGTNVNRDCGSTHIDGLKKFVRENGLDVGFAYDGDADRCIAVDECGNEVNGDEILYIFADRLRQTGCLDKNTVVTTVMSNLGLYKAFDKAGINYERTQVGDRYVYECMEKNGYKLGGEQSGHIILHKYATTGDGILTSIMLCEEMLDKKATLSKLASPVHIYPQITKSIRVSDRDGAAVDADVIAKRDEIEKELGDNGRILIRKSGTEPVIRVMVECDDAELCEKYINSVFEIISKKGY
ncbi:MAG: phosphoglucosamine mutase, partial [Clostridiales bacterium]|nr:phosphoglucosamine mutase [Clostridiales bacterium]